MSLGDGVRRGIDKTVHQEQGGIIIQEEDANKGSKLRIIDEILMFTGKDYFAAFSVNYRINANHR
jgi:hypothetical protein